MNGDNPTASDLLRMYFCNSKDVESMDLEAHTKALDLLIAYSESEQYDPSVDPMYILMSNMMVITELRYIKQHIESYHEGVYAMEVVDSIKQHINIIVADDKNLRASVYVKGWD